jgi:hypothetical protein
MYSGVGRGSVVVAEAGQGDVAADDVVFAVEAEFVKSLSA